MRSTFGFASGDHCAQPPSQAAIEAEQNKAAAASDIAAEAAAKATPRLVDVDAYPELQAGPALTAPTLINAMSQLAQALRSQADTAPEAVEPATGLKLPPTPRGDAMGLGALWRRRATRWRFGSLTPSTQVI